MSLLGCNAKWSARKLNGTQVKIETVEEIANDLHYQDLFGTYRFIWIEEADALPPIAQVRFLTLLDDLPNGCAVVCTSNCKIDEFKGRFQTRFKIFEIDPPAPHELEALLRLHVEMFRQALLDAEGVTETAGQKILNFEIVLLEVMYK